MSSVSVFLVVLQAKSVRPHLKQLQQSIQMLTTLQMDGMMNFLVPLQIDPFWKSSEKLIVFVLFLLLFFSSRISLFVIILCKKVYILILARAVRWGLKWALRRGQNIFMPKSINSITIIITLEGIEEINNEKMTTKHSEE